MIGTQNPGNGIGWSKCWCFILNCNTLESNSTLLFILVAMAAHNSEAVHSFWVESADLFPIVQFTPDPCLAHPLELENSLWFYIPNSCPSKQEFDLMPISISKLIWYSTSIQFFAAKFWQSNEAKTILYTKIWLLLSNCTTIHSEGTMGSICALKETWIARLNSRTPRLGARVFRIKLGASLHVHFNTFSACAEK